MLKSFIEKALAAEMEEHLDDVQRSKGNKRNGKGKKKSRVVLDPLISKRPKIVTVTSNQN